jgi:Ca-activated chloride channel homolog
MRRVVTKRNIILFFCSILAVLLIVTGIQYWMVFKSGDTIDMMLAQTSEQSGMKAELTSDYLRSAMGLDKPWRPDFWPFDDESLQTNSSSYSAYSSSVNSNDSSRSTGDNNIGFSTGGAKDIVNFRENIKNGYLPQPTDITCEGLFYDYYFDTGMNEPCNGLFCPSYTTAVTRDPISNQKEYYLSVGLNSGLKESDFQRKKLNLVIVLDISSSMTEDFEEYYYDGEDRNRDYAYEYEIMRKEKIDCAKDAVISVLGQLDEDDRFAVVLFNENARLAMPFTTMGHLDIHDVEKNIRDIRASGSTNIDAGMERASEQFNEEEYLDRAEYENRIIVITDAQTNTADTSSGGLFGDVSRNAGHNVYTTFIGIGVDFNSRLIELLSKTKGVNYYSVYTPLEFSQRVEEDFDFMVTPLVFDLNLSFESRGWSIERVFGSPQADLSTGSLMYVSTLFPSKSVNGNTKGGLVLLKLRRLDDEADSRIYLRVEYEDRNGRDGHSESVIRFDDISPEYFENTGIRKGVLLTRFAALMQNWMHDERRYLNRTGNWDSSINEDSGITTGFDYMEDWERQSVSLRVSRPYSRLFDKFYGYFEEEMNEIGDYNLEQELDILETLVDYRR